MPAIGDSGKIERLALELADFDRISVEFSRRLGLAHSLDFTETAAAGPGGSVAVVVFKCDLLRAALICDAIRSRDRKLGQDESGIYFCKETAWVRVPNKFKFTVTEVDRRTGQQTAVLNPQLFKIVTEAAPVALPAARRVEF